MTSNKNMIYESTVARVEYSPTSVPTLACSMATNIACSMMRRSGVRTWATSDSNSKSVSASFMLLRLWSMYNFSICTVWNNKTHYNVIFVLSSNSGRQNVVVSRNFGTRHFTVCFLIVILSPPEIDQPQVQFWIKTKCLTSLISPSNQKLHSVPLFCSSHYLISSSKKTLFKNLTNLQDFTLALA